MCACTSLLPSPSSRSLIVRAVCRIRTSVPRDRVFSCMRALVCMCVCVCRPTRVTHSLATVIFFSVDPFPLCLLRSPSSLLSPVASARCFSSSVGCPSAARFSPSSALTHQMPHVGVQSYLFAGAQLLSDGLPPLVRLSPSLCVCVLRCHASRTKQENTYSKAPATRMHFSQI